MEMYELLQYSPVAHAIGMTLLHFLWQGAAVALVLGCALAVLKRGSPQVRYLVSCLTLLLMFLLPVVTFCYLYATSDVKGPPAVPSRVYALIEEAKARAEVEAATVSLTGDGAQGVAEGGGNTADATTRGNPAAEAGRFSLEIPWDKVRAFCHSLSPWCSVFWGFGVALLTIRLIGALYFTGRLRKRHATLLNGHWQETVDRLRDRLGITRAVTLLQSGRVLVPTMMGWLRPVILLPASALTGLTPGQLEALLAHELAHVRRHDYLVNLLQNVVETLLFYHPVVWWVSKQIRDDRELCCDDIVLEVCGDARVYATALSDMLTLRMGESAVALAASGGSLPNRLRRMLGIAPPAAGRMARGVAGTIVVALLLTVSTFFALRAAAAGEIDPEAQQRFEKAVALGWTEFAYDEIERFEKRREAIEILDTLTQEYPDVDEFRGQLGLALYPLLWSPYISQEEKREVASYGIELLEPVAKDYQTKSIAREYRLALSMYYRRSENMLDAVKTARELVEVEPDNPVYHKWLALGCLVSLGKSLIEAGEPYAATIREAWDHHLQGELLGARYDSLYYEFQTFRWGVRDGKHFADTVANHLRGLGRTEEAIETYEMALTSFANVVEKDPQFYGDLIMIRRQYEGFLKSIGRPAEAEQVAAETDALRERLFSRDTDFFRAYRDVTAERFRPTRGARVDYTVRIATPGEYQLHLRLEAHDAKSCCILAYVEELADGLGGPIADLYRMNCQPGLDHDFATEPWTSTGQFEDAGSKMPVVWSIPAAGDYTLRICGIEDGATLDALVFQRSDLLAPEGDGPDESQQAATGVFVEGGGRITMEAEHFAARKSFFIEGMGGEWRVVPGEDAGDVAHANARGQAYIQVLPDMTPSPESLLQFAETDRGNAQVWTTLGDTYAANQDYEKAVEAYSKAVELNSMAEAARDVTKVAELPPDSAYDWYLVAMAQLAQGDSQGYRATCADVLDRFSGIDDPVEAHWAAWACSLAPHAVADMTLPLQLAEMAAQRDASNTMLGQAYAVVLYRAGRLDEALAKLQAVADNPPSNTSPAYSWFFLAMTHYRLGNDDEAQNWFQKATEQAEKENQSGAPWNRRVTLKLLQEEAEDVLNGMEVARTGS